MKRPPQESAREFVVSGTEARMRLDRFLAQKVPEMSRARLQNLIRAGSVLVNREAVRPRHTLRTGDRVRLTPPSQRALDKISHPAMHEAPAIPLSLLFEDNDLLVINKPAGISVHAGAGKDSGTLVDALLGHCGQLSLIGGEARPGIVHRLDRETSGCLVVAKNDAAHLALSKQFAARTVVKIYLALVLGRLRKNFISVDAPIARHRVHRTKMAVAREGGRAARTDFRVLRAGAEASLLECRLHSGRTHQIRVHLQHLGHPILGDKVYAGRRAGNFPRQMLHAWKLGFDHPRSGERLHFEAPLPEDFETAIRSSF